MSRRMKKSGVKPRIVVVGTRGFPGVVGGVETHCEHLYSRIGESGDFDITVVRRLPYITPEAAARSYPGVRFIDIRVPVWPAFEAWSHTFLGVVRARRLGADIVHIHSIGPALWAPLAKAMGMKVVATYHSADYHHSRWGRFARFALRLGERMQARFSDEIICVGQPMKDMLRDRYGRDAHLIFNGVETPQQVGAEDFARLWPDLEPGKYVLAASRHVPEKNLHLLVEAWRRIAPEGLKLVIAGDASPATPYSRALRRTAAESGIILPGYVRGKALIALMHYARLFVLPSAHEGMPIALLEAMSHGLDVLVSDIPANRLAELSPEDFFLLSSDEGASAANLAEALTRKLSAPLSARNYDLSAYDWARIAGDTCQVYRRILTRQ